MRDYLLSGGTAEWHLVVHVRPALKRKGEDGLPYPSDDGVHSLSDDTIRKRLAAVLKTKVERLCVIFDAEEKDAQFRWIRIRKLLVEAGYLGLPEQMDPKGLVAEADGLPRLGVWIMPDNLSSGMIEDFYLRAIPEDDRELVRSRRFVREIPDEERLFAKKTSKATLGVWLAIQDDPIGPGLSIKRGLIRHDAGLLPTFSAWLDRLFGG
jgi:hypothetical protein